MKYNCLTLDQTGTSFNLSTQIDDIDRVRTKAVPMGCPGRAWIYYPSNTKRPEHYKKVLVNYVKNKILEDMRKGAAMLDGLIALINENNGNS
jgi:hypothetical protein